MTTIGQIDELLKRLTAALPPGMQTMKADLEKNFRVVLQGFFDKMDLVTREEFDRQIKVLQKTREKLTELEKKMEEREKNS